ncbi:hypothetical protein CNBC4270 [Cryptococcus deneoformans B-3501A]|uniref:hypothetical protein n=1 Tax=Cryptococcus deneoformans (strain B-3501A) TaxID=283643 RepID=UPI000042DA59|nr:hypothetical protein CNBC4270 [Cryptococcus neoformans var. neoformans B-3501A]EAL21854.1 hypothetical protein CNBC4270 [Cryptococcus neoformans var. neoformans B-3501A]
MIWCEVYRTRKTQPTKRKCVRGLCVCREYRLKAVCVGYEYKTIALYAAPTLKWRVRARSVLTR